MWNGSAPRPLLEPLIFPPDNLYRKNTWLRTMCCLQNEPITIRRRKAKLAKWLPGGEETAATEEQEEPEADPGDQPGESAPSQPTEPGKK